jgi:hypothetical protein
MNEACTTYLVIKTRKNNGLHVRGVLRNNHTLPMDKTLVMFIKNEQPSLVEPIYEMS